MKDYRVSELAGLGLTRWRVVVDGKSYRVLARERADALRYAAREHAALHRREYGRTRYAPPCADQPAHAWLFDRYGAGHRVTVEHDTMVGEEPRTYHVVGGGVAYVHSG